ncbi:MAG: metallophosphoesterase [Thermoanaerobaculia bacterium]
MRTASFIVIAIIVFAIFNFAAIRTLLLVHPRRKRLIIAAAVIGNLMWLFFPLLRTLTPMGRITRAVFGPPWFAWNSFTILYSAFTLVLAILRLPLLGRVSFAKFARGPSTVVLSLGLLASMAGLYQALVPLRVEHVPIEVEGLPAGAEGTRIALLADLHVGLFTRRSRLQQFFETARELRPDVVILAGDLVDDDPYFVPQLLEGTRFLDPHTPLLAVLGNHEMYGDPDRVIAGLRGSRIRLLVNEGIPFRSLWLAGISDYAAQQKDLAPDIARAVNTRPPATLPILLAHQPKAFDEARSRHIPLTLVGHTHGGQCGIRPLRWSLAGVFLPYHMGLYRRGASQLYVNTGTGFWFVPFRLGMTGEITLIELRRPSTSPQFSSILSVARSSARVGPMFTIAIGTLRSAARFTNR